MDPVNKILMLTPEGEEVLVDQKNFDAAIEQKLEPALEYVTPEGKTVVVRRKNFDAAEKQGLVMKPLYEARKAPMEPLGPVAAAAYGLSKFSPVGPFREEISGAIQSPKGAAQAAAELLGADYRSSPELQKYRKAKERYKMLEEEAAQQEPVAYGAGVGAGILSGIGVGAGGLGAAPSVARAAGVGAGYGAVSGVGEAEGSLSDVALGAGLGAATGGATGAAAPFIGRKIQDLSAAARGQAGRSAYAATGALKSDINKLYNRTPEEIGQELLDSDIVRLGTRRGSPVIGERIEGKLKEFGKGQKQLLSELEDVSPNQFETQKLIDALESRVAETRKLPGAGNQALADRLQKEADVLRQVYGGVDELGEAIPPQNISLPASLELKRAFDKGAKYQSPMSQADAVAAAREARKLANQQIDETVAAVGGPEVSQAYRAQRRSASLLQDAKRAAEEQAKRDQANLSIGLREALSASPGATIGGLAGAAGGGLAGGAVGGLAGGAAAVGLSKLMKAYGPSTTAKMMQQASELFAKEGFQRGMQSLTTIYGAEAASDLAMAMMDTGNFKNPEQLADLLGSAVLGSDLTKAVGSLGAGLGYALEGQSFSEGSAERMKQYEENPAKYSGIASTIGSIIPTGKLGKVGSAVVRGVRTLDEMLSPTGRVKNAPDMLRIKLPSGDEFPSKVKTGKEFKEAVEGLKLGNENTVKIEEVKPGVVEGYIDHPDYPKHTTFRFEKDREGTWALNANFRADQYADVPELKGSSTRLRQEVAKAVGGIVSDAQNRNTSSGVMSYLKDPEALLTRPEMEKVKRGQPKSKFYTPGSEEQKQEFIKALEQSYGEAPDKTKKLREEQEQLRQEMERSRIARERRAIEEAEAAQRASEEQSLMNSLMNDPEFAPLRESASSRKRQMIEDYIRSLDQADMETARTIERDLTPEYTNFARRVLETPSGSRESAKQSAIFNRLIEENRPLNTQEMTARRNEAIRRSRENEVRSEINWLNRYKDKDISEVSAPADSVERLLTNLFRDSRDTSRFENMLEANRQEFIQARNRAIEAIREENYSDLQRLRLVENMQAAANRFSAILKAKKMMEEAQNTAFELSSKTNVSYEDMFKQMKPYIEASNRVMIFENMADVKDIKLDYMKEDSDVLKSILNDKPDRAYSWDILFDMAVRRKAAIEELQRRK